jgi:hypothetical protein
VPATIIRTPSRGRKVTSATGVSNLWWHHDLTPAKPEVMIMKRTVAAASQGRPAAAVAVAAQPKVRLTTSERDGCSRTAERRSALVTKENRLRNRPLFATMLT